MAFIETRFPDTLALGAVGGPMFSTSVVATQGGGEQRNRNWTSPRGKWEVGQVDRNESETRILLAFFRAVAKGRLNSFLFRDPAPGESTGTHEQLGIGDGANRYFTLVRHYEFGDESFDRPIYHADEETLVVFVDGVALASDQFIYDAPVVTLVEIPTNGQVVAASFTFDVEVRFESDRLPIRQASPGIYSWESIVLWEERLSQPGGIGIGESPLDMVKGPDYLATWDITILGVND